MWGVHLRARGLVYGRRWGLWMGQVGPVLIHLRAYRAPLGVFGGTEVGWYSDMWAPCVFVRYDVTLMVRSVARKTDGSVFSHSGEVRSLSLSIWVLRLDDNRVIREEKPKLDHHLRGKGRVMMRRDKDAEVVLKKKRRDRWSLGEFKVWFFFRVIGRRESGVLELWHLEWGWSLAVKLKRSCYSSQLGTSFLQCNDLDCENFEFWRLN